MSAYDMTLYIENLKDSTKRTVRINEKFSKVAGYKINIQKSNSFLYNNNKIYEKKRK